MLLTFFLIVFKLSISSKLIGVINLFRHGARSPMTINGDYYDILNSKWDLNKAELTSSGIRQHFLSGLRFRQRYILEKKLFSKNYKQSEFAFFSTNKNRTIQSAYSRMEGIFNGLENEYLILPPVRIMESPSIVFQNNEVSICPKLNKAKYSHYNSSVKLKLKYYINNFENAIWPKLLTRLNLGNTKELNYNLMNKIAEAIDANLFEGKDLSHLKLSKTDINFILEFKKFYVFYGKKSDQQIKISGIPLFDRIFKDIELIKSKKIKYIGYSIHDNNEVTFLRICKMIDPSIPIDSIGFDSEIIIEYYSDGNLHVIYNDKLIMKTEINSLKLKLMNFIGDYNTFSNYCKLNKNEKYTQPSKYLRLLIFFMILNLGLLVLMVFISKTKKYSLFVSNDSL